MAACPRGSGHKLVIGRRSCKFHNDATPQRASFSVLQAVFMQVSVQSDPATNPFSALRGSALAPVAQSAVGYLFGVDDQLEAVPARIFIHGCPNVRISLEADP
jgi:hypothetical protein